mgnify:CR=1 FL=1
MPTIEMPIKFVITTTGNEHIDELMMKKFLFVSRIVWQKAMTFHFIPDEIHLHPKLTEGGALYAITMVAIKGNVETEVEYHLTDTFMQA